MSADIVQLFSTNCNDIPGMLRALADEIDAGERQYDTMTVVAEGDTFEVFGWGLDNDTNSMLASLQVGVTMICNARLGVGE